MFANFYQPRMAELFRSASPLEFGIGYRWRKNESNLLLAHNESPLSNQELTAQPKPDANVPVAAAPSAKKHESALKVAGRALTVELQPSSPSAGKDGGTSWQPTLTMSIAPPPIMITIWLAQRRRPTSLLVHSSDPPRARSAALRARENDRKQINAAYS